MPTPSSTDYLVVGAGATGMAFTDALVNESDATVVMVDGRDGPGGHWRDGYPFLRLHQPSACYGVASTQLGDGGPDPESPDEQFGERATGAEVVAYYESVLDDLRGTGRVVFHGGAEYLGDRRLRLASGEEVVVDAGKVVDATRMQSSVPAASPPPFPIDDDVRWVPAGGVADHPEPEDGYVIVGAGKTAQDTCIHLLDRGVDPGAITWIRPRDPWLTPRRFFQPGAGLSTTIDGFSRSIEAAATAESMADLFDRLEGDGLLVRIDESVAPGTYRGATVSDNELAKLRSIDDVVRRGYVRRITKDEIELDEGSIPTGPGRLHVHCAARGLSASTTTPIFDGDHIVPQQVRFGMIPYCAALIAKIELSKESDEEANRLCQPIRLPDAAEDWAVMNLLSMRNDYQLLKDPELAQWVDGCRLNVSAGLMAAGADPVVQKALARYAAHAKGAVENLARLLAS